jgi:tRNA threonylcarbamoyl adenosine modification protein (Sua5/YciO/YrdC/YwlC family)
VSGVTTSDLAAIARAVARGQVVVIPTDTVYGLACDPADAGAVQQIYDIKRRPDDLELTLLAADAGQLEQLVRVTPAAAALTAAFWPGGLSVVLPVGERRLAIPRRGATLSVRVPDHALARELLRATGPLATTSANRHGEPPALTAADAVRAMGSAVYAALDGGPAAGRASTIIDCTTPAVRVLREGPIPSAALFALLEAQGLSTSA